MNSGIRLAAPFSSGLIVQQRAPIRVSGQTEPFSHLKAELSRRPANPVLIQPNDPNYGLIHTSTVDCDPEGCFCVELPAFKASLDTFELKLQALDGTILLLDDIRVGEVYLLLGDGLLAEALPTGLTGGSGLPAIKNAPEQRFYCVAAPTSGWQPAADAGLAGLSAAGLYFSRELRRELNGPIGLIQTTAPGRRLTEWLATGSHSAWDEQVLPLSGLALAGIIWSGSPQDLANPPGRRSDVVSLGQNLRTVFKGPEEQQPALLMMLHPTGYAGQASFYQQTLINEDLTYAAHLLDPPTALVPVAGLPENAPWPTLGTRLAMICLGLLYQRKAPKSAPECESIELVGGKMMLTFSNAGDGLRLAGSDSRVRGFAVCGSDRVYREASARILFGVRVMVWHEAIPNPLGVTYGFYDTNQTANLVSKDHLPVVPFRSDQVASVYHLPREWVHCDDLALWQAAQEGVEIRLEKTTKTDGEAALVLSYSRTTVQPVTWGPILDRSEDFPPLDLHRANRLLIDFFNPDRQEKRVQLALMAMDPPGAREARSAVHKLEPALRWQTLSIDLEDFRKPDNRLDLTKVIRLEWILEDRGGKGSVYFDNIRLVTD
jgi:hypothetical protein